MGIVRAAKRKADDEPGDRRNVPAAIEASAVPDGLRINRRQDQAAIATAMLTTPASERGSGTGMPSSIMPSICNSIASRM